MSHGIILFGLLVAIRQQRPWFMTFLNSYLNFADGTATENDNSKTLMGGTWIAAHSWYLNCARNKFYKDETIRDTHGNFYASLTYKLCMHLMNLFLSEKTLKSLHFQ